MSYRYLLLVVTYIIIILTVFIDVSKAENPWVKQIGTNSIDNSRGIAIDSTGDVYITGYTAGSLGGTFSGGNDAFLAKYDKEGNIKWTKQLGTNSFDGSLGIATDRAGGIYITGWTDGGSLGGPSVGRTDAFLARYDRAGNLQWTKQLGVVGATSISQGVATDSTGNIYMTGYTTGSVGGSSSGSDDAFIAKYDNSGNLKWTRQLGASSNSIQNPAATNSLGVATDSTGNIYMTGYTTGSVGGSSSGSDDAFIAKYDNSGNLKWTRQLGTGSGTYGFGVATDKAGGVYITGETAGSLGGSSSGSSDAFLAKYDSAGNLKWTKQLGTSSSDSSFGVAIDKAGGVYITGETAGSLGGSSSGSSDAFLAKYDSAGNLKWTKQLGTSSSDSSFGVATSDTGNVYITGETKGSLNGPNLGYTDAFVANLSPQTYGIFMGINFTAVKFMDDVVAVRDRMVAGGILKAENTVMLNNFDNNNYVAVWNALESFQLSAGDTIYFYFSGHGGTSGSGEGTITKEDETLTNGLTNIISDDELYTLLSPYNGLINKMIFLDACLSGGFWGNNSEIDKDLNWLSNVALLAAAEEDGSAWADEETGRGYFSNAVLAALTNKGGYFAADYNRDGVIDFGEWEKYLNSKDWWPKTFDTQAYEKNMGDLVNFDPSMLKFQAYKSEDFTGLTTSSVSNVPEPTTMLLFGLGLIGLAGIRRKIK